MTAEEGTRDVLENQIPKIQALMKSRDLHVDNIDVFCEQGVYSVEQTERILRAGVEAGMAINFHGEELHRLHSAEVGDLCAFFLIGRFVFRWALIFTSLWVLLVSTSFFTLISKIMA